MLGWAPTPGPGPYSSETWQSAPSTRPNDSLPGEVFSLPGQTCFPSVVNVVGIGPRIVGTPPSGRKIEMPQCPQSKMTFNITGPVLNGVGTNWTATSWDPNSYELKYVKMAGTDWVGSTWTASYNNFTWPPFTCNGTALAGYASDVVVSSAYWGERYTFHVTDSAIVPASAFNPDGRAPCYYVPGLVLPVSRCPGLQLYGSGAVNSEGALTSGFGIQVPGSIAGNSYLAVIRMPVTGSDQDSHVVAQLGGCNNGQSGELLGLRTYGGQIQTLRIDCSSGNYAFHGVSSVVGFGPPTEFRVLQITLPQGSGVANKIYLDGVDAGISFESIPGLAFDCCYPGPYGVSYLALSQGPPSFVQNINSLRYVAVLQGTTPLTPTQAAALAAAANAGAPTATTTTLAPTTTVPVVPLGALTARIVRGPNSAVGAWVYTVTLKVTGAVSGGVYEFVVPSGHVPEPVPPDRTTHRYVKSVVSGEVVWEYSLVAPRGVFRAEVYSAGGSTPLSTVEVK